MSAVTTEQLPARPQANPPRWPFILLLLLVAATVVWRFAPNSFARPSAPAREVSARGELAPNEVTLIERFKAASPGVVFITTLSLQRDFFSMRVFETPRGTGSGFVWDQEGHIVTNFHVIAGGNRAKVALADQSVWDATVVGYEEHKDLAVLHIDAPRDRLRPLPIGRSADLEVGQSVLAIGNPFGLDHTLTTGIISALGREIQSVSQRPIQDVIQTDAAINPGNSGGPLLDSAGRLIGINTAIYSQNGGSAGIGFAVPVDTVNRIVPQLIKFGRVTRPGLGVGFLPDNFARRNGIRGVVVGQVLEGSAAASAGLRPTTQDRRGRITLGDIVTAIDDNPIQDSQDVFRALDQHQVGDEVTLAILRDGETRVAVKVRLQDINNRPD